ncbi:hypothetical protein DF186_16535, partial [Enterococcus hirae]
VRPYDRFGQAIRRTYRAQGVVVVRSTHVERHRGQVGGIETNAVGRRRIPVEVAEDLETRVQLVVEITVDGCALEFGQQVAPIAVVVVVV